MGWHPDPSGLHELRYFSQGRPTHLVRDGAVESYDTPPPTAAPGPDAVDREARPDLWLDPPPPPVPGALPLAPLGYGPSRPEHGPSVPPAPLPKHSRRTVVVGAVVLVALLAAILGVAATGGGPSVPGAGMTPTAFVMSATQTTLAHRTAQIVITGTVSTSGETVTLRGTGETDLTAGTTTANLTANGAGTSIVEHELAVGGHLYMGLTVDGTDIADIAGGRHWIELPVSMGGSAAASLGSGAVNPITQLQLLTKRGNTVRPLGTSVIGGVTTSGYAIVPSRHTIDQAIETEIVTGHLSAAEAQQVRQEASSFSSFTIDVWFDASGLMRRMAVDFGTTSTTSADVTMTFENYGTPVIVAPPAPGDVMSFSAFMSAVQSADTLSH